MAISIHVRSATEAEIPVMVALLGATFQDGDAVGEYMFPDERQRRTRQPRMFAAMMKYRYVPDGGADVAITDDGRIVGVLLWSRSWAKPNVVRKIKENLALLAAMKTRVLAGLMVEAAAARGKPKQRHIYAMYIGVEKAWHGYGAAQALFGRLRERADAEAAGLYGNCQKRLLPFYVEAFPDGLITGTTTLGRRGPAFYFLYREAISQHAEPIAGR
jgi:GNAT superfamily N-acetyltransferase